jgi:LPS export ABC transporter protein LptC
MVKNTRILFLRSIAILSGLAMLFSCEPDLQTIESLTRDENQPTETAANLRIVYSSNGLVQMIMEAPVMKRFAGEQPYMELPEGFVMIFYDSLMNENSRISAKYAIQHEHTHLIDARNDVVVQNMAKNEMLNTEQLIWDRMQEKIYTEKFVKITTPEEVLYGDGFESDQQFNFWVIKNPKGTFYLETDPVEEPHDEGDDFIFQP